MDFETKPLYNKMIVGPATPKEVRNVTNKHVLQKQKKYAWEIKNGAVKMYGTCQNKKGLLKKKINQ